MWDNLAIFKEKGLFVTREIYIFAEHLHIFLGHEDVSAPLLGFHRPHNFWIGSFRFDRDTRCQLIIVCAKKEKTTGNTATLAAFQNLDSNNSSLSQIHQPTACWYKIQFVLIFSTRSAFPGFVQVYPIKLNCFQHK